MSLNEWNFAEVWEKVAARLGDETALIHGPLSRSWSELDGRAEQLALGLVGAGLGRQSKVAQCCRNGPEYIETLFACFKASLVPVNTNYRYGVDELTYLWSDSDTEAVVFDAEFAPACEEVRGRLPGIRYWVQVTAPGEECPPWAVRYEDALAAGAAAGGPPSGRWPRSGDDLYLLYTGGTTGMPKGVMWRQHDLFLMTENQYGRFPPERADAVAYVSRIEGPGPRVLPGPPLMHGAAAWFTMAALSTGGSVVTLPGRRFDPIEMLDALSARRVKGTCVVGDAFARPLVAAIKNDPARWDLSALRLIVSSGAMLSERTKADLAALVPSARLVDALGTSESGSIGSETYDPAHDGPGKGATFRLSESVRVVDGIGHDVVPGSGVAGRLAVAGRIPLGYYNDADKTASTFLTIGGRRHVVAGDWAVVESDGSIHLLGRGSQCINSGGEKVFPEEVEEVLKELPHVRDASVIGIPDERLGEAVAALVELEPGALFEEAVLRDHARTRLASFKSPRAIAAVEAIARHANGKMDYAAMRRTAEELFAER